MNQSASLEQAMEADERFIDFRHVVRTIVKRKWIIAAVVVAGVTLAVVYTLRQEKIYEAAASVVINPQAPQVFGAEVQEVVQLGAGGLLGNAEYYNTQIEIIVGYDLAKETISRHGLANHSVLVPPDVAEGKGAAERLDFAARTLQDALTAAMVEESRIVQVRVRHPDPALARDLANKHVDTYMARNLASRSQDTGAAARILSSELDGAEKRVRESEEKLYAFKRDNQILSVSLEDKLAQLAADLGRYSTALSDARIKRIDVANLRRQAQAAMASDVLESPIFALVGNSSAEALKGLYVQEKQEFVDRAEELGPRNPEYAAQKKKVDELYAALQREARLALREVEQRHAMAIASEKEFEAEVARLTTQSFELGPKIMEYNRLKRQGQADEDNYKLVIGRLKTSELTRGNDLNNIAWHEHARTPAEPVHPRIALNIALAGLLSLALGLLAAFGIEYMDRTIKTAEDVEPILGAPVLGLIPMVSEAPSGTGPEIVRDRDLYVFQHPSSRAAECCRAIRTNILFSGADRELRVLTITSPNPKEGKTTSVIYLGTTMAQSGQRVLLVDTDMRKPRLHQSMRISRERGLSNLIVGNASFEEAIASTGVPNLDVLPCGPTPPNPAELLLTQRFQQLIAELRGRYERIILDSPPLLAVADAAVLGRLSDGVIMIAKSHETNRDDVARAGRQLRDVQAPLVGVVINSLDLSSRTYGYAGYAYAYGEPTASAKAEA